MEHKPSILHGSYYHIYNRGLNKSPLFLHPDDFNRFIGLLKRYILPIADIYSYAMMSNHFHLAVRIKIEEEIGWMIYERLNENDKPEKWQITFDIKESNKAYYPKPAPEAMFKHLFNAYSRYFNKKYNRSGKLFEERYERKNISSENQLRQLIVNINRNPEHHRIVKRFQEYQWTSYHEIVGDVISVIEKEKILQLFDTLETFQLAMHKTDFEEWLKTEE